MTRWLFILPSRIGDAVLTTGVIEWMRNHYPESKIVLAASSLIYPLFEDLPELDYMILFNKRTYERHWLDLWKKIRFTKWEGVADFRGSIVSFFVRSKHRLIKNTLNSALQKRHRVIQLAHLLHKKPPRPLPSPTLWISSNREKLAKKLIGDKPTLAVAPTANWIGKQWPIERFIETIQEFCAMDKNAQVAVFAAPHEKPMVAPLFNSLKSLPILDLIDPNLSLLTLAACIKQCKLFLGNDSGLMHISASVNTPTIGLFGPSDDAVYGPWNSRERTLYPIIRSAAYNTLIAQPDFSFETREMNYMNDISVKDVYRKIQERWNDVNPMPQLKSDREPFGQVRIAPRRLSQNRLPYCSERILQFIGSDAGKTDSLM